MADEHARAVHELTRDGLTPRDIAQALGVHERAVRAVLSSDRPAESFTERRSRIEEGEGCAARGLLNAAPCGVFRSVPIMLTSPGKFTVEWLSKRRRIELGVTGADG